MGNEDVSIVIPGVGEFTPTEAEAATLANYSKRLPASGDRELLTALYIATCVQLALQSQSRRDSGTHVAAKDLLSVAHLAALTLFGPEAKKWLAAIGIGSSATFGEAVFRLAAAGMLSLRDEDRPEDFARFSELDEV